MGYNPGLPNGLEAPEAGARGDAALPEQMSNQPGKGGQMM
jgi:hypothetical protein